MATARDREHSLTIAPSPTPRHPGGPRPGNPPHLAFGHLLPQGRRGRVASECSGFSGFESPALTAHAYARAMDRHLRHVGGQIFDRRAARSAIELERPQHLVNRGGCLGLGDRDPSGRASARRVGSRKRDPLVAGRDSQGGIAGADRRRCSACFLSWLRLGFSGDDVGSFIKHLGGPALCQPERLSSVSRLLKSGVPGNAFLPGSRCLFPEIVADVSDSLFGARARHAPGFAVSGRCSSGTSNNMAWKRMFGDKEFADREVSIALEVEEACVGLLAGCLRLP